MNAIRAMFVVVCMVLVYPSLAFPQTPGEQKTDVKAIIEQAVEQAGKQTEPEQAGKQTVEPEQSGKQTVEHEQAGKQTVEPEQAVEPDIHAVKQSVEPVEPEHAGKQTVEPEQAVEPDQAGKQSVEPVESEQAEKQSVEPEQAVGQTVELEQAGKQTVEPEQAVEPDQAGKQSVEPEQAEKKIVEPEQAGKQTVEPDQSLNFIQGSDGIDFVFTYYNSGDAQSNIERENYQIKEEGKSAGPERFTDAGELKYALRGVHRHASWVRHVYIVMADGQRKPDFLKEGDGLSVVRHSEIFPSGSKLPTYNSKSIESVLHKIPGLTNTFMYFNDDMFIIRNVTKDAFFDERGRPRISYDQDSRVAKDMTPADPTWLAGRRNANKAATEVIGSMSKYVRAGVPSHVGYPLRVDISNEVEEKLRGHFDAIRQTRFRTNSDVWTIMAIDKICVDSGKCESTGFDGISHGAIHLGVYSDEEVSQKLNDMLKQIEKDKITLFCINGSRPNVVRDIQNVMESLLPNKSRWEN